LLYSSTHSVLFLETISLMMMSPDVAVSQIFSEITATESGRFDSRLTTDIAVASEVVDDSKLDVGHKLKVSIPIIPLILSYEGEIDLKSGLNLKKGWHKLMTWIRDKE